MKSEGLCSYCEKMFPGSGMTKHLLNCPIRKSQNEKESTERDIFMISARSGPFWIYFELDADSMLKQIDSFLRKLWLECCGHLSRFTINKTNYSISPETDYSEKSMSVSIKKVLTEGMSFTHEYDFGTTTSLDLKVISVRKGRVNGVKLISRNDIPNFKCKCGSPAKEICSECVWEGKGLLCKKCAKSHECGEEMLLPFVNSPRTGMCGYTG